MEKKRVVLTFPHQLVDQPITYHLIKDYDLMINILRARVTPKEEGRLVMEIEGSKESLKKGIAYLEELGVNIQPLAQDVSWDQQRCTRCSVCVPICPTGAFSVNRKNREVSFDKEKCIACGLCVPVCPYKAIKILF